jgi:hypothetical protein
MGDAIDELIEDVIVDAYGEHERCGHSTRRSRTVPDSPSAAE